MQQPAQDTKEVAVQNRIVGNPFGISWLRIEWVDSANLIRFKSVPYPRDAEAFKRLSTIGVGVVASLMSLPVQGDMVAPNSGVPVSGEARLLPLWSTFSQLPYAPGWGRVSGRFVSVRTLKPWNYCPRAFLQNQLDILDREFGLTLKCGVENEVVFLKNPSSGDLSPDANLVVTNRPGFCHVSATDITQKLIDEVLRTMEQMNIPIELYHPESGEGQHEFVMRYDNALVTADREIAFRSAIKGVAVKMGYQVTFIPKPTGTAGNGQHLHLSLWETSTNKNITSVEGEIKDSEATDVSVLSERTQHFMAGILHHLPSLMAVTTPSNNSYRRLLPSHWSGAYQVWGFDNREAALRVTTNPYPGEGPTNFELKTHDGSSNPYLSLGALIACGMDGLRQKMYLPPPVQCDPAVFDKGPLAITDANVKEGEPSTDSALIPQRHDVKRLPATLSAALYFLQRNGVIEKAMGSELFKAYLAVKQCENTFFKDKDQFSEVKIIWDRY